MCRGGEHVARHQPGRAFAGGDPGFVERVHARAERQHGRRSSRIGHAERPTRQLGPPRACAEREVHAVVDDEPRAGDRLRSLEAAGERLQARSADPAGAEVQCASWPERRHHRARDVDEVGTRDDLVARDGVDDGEGRGRRGRRPGAHGRLEHTSPYGEAGATVSNRSPTATPRPCAHWAGLNRRFPAGWTTVSRTAPAPHATSIPTSSTDRISPAVWEVPRGAIRAPNSFTSTPRTRAQAPGLGSYARMWRPTSCALAVQSTRADSRVSLGA